MLCGFVGSEHVLNHHEPSVDYVVPKATGLRHLAGAVASRFATLFDRAPAEAQTLRGSRLGIVAACLTLDPRKALEIGPNTVRRLYGSSGQAVVDIRNELGEFAGHRYIVRRKTASFP